MPLDLSGFNNQPEQWAGLYKTADALEKNKYRQQELALQQASRRNAAGTFLSNYLDPKDLMTGTAFDPMIVQGLQSAMQAGSALAMQGADTPTLMMALGPMMNKLIQYSTNAKTINKQVDDQISKMKESGLTGYNFSTLKDEALRRAFYKTDAKGNQQLDPTQADPSVNWIQKAIDEAPDKVTTAAGLDAFAKNSPMEKNLRDIQDYDAHGNLTRSKVHIIGQNWLTEEKDKRGATVGLVPKHDVAMEGQRPIFHTVVDAKGNEKKEPVKLLDENVFDDMVQRRPDILHYINGLVTQHLKEYKDNSGEDIGLNHPKAKLVARAIAYKELEQRKAGTIEHAYSDKPSSEQVKLNIGLSPDYNEMLRRNAAAREQGKINVNGGKKQNAVEILGHVMNNEPEYLQGKVEEKNGRNMINITGLFPEGGIYAGRGADFKYKGIYYDPKEKQLVLDTEKTDKVGIVHSGTEVIPQKDMEKFIYSIAGANGVKAQDISKLVTQFGFKQKQPEPGSPAADLEGRMKGSWRDAKFPFGKKP